MSHSTTPELADIIVSDRRLLGSRPADRRYDGALGEPDAPPCVYFHVSPATERTILPFSWYPSRVPGGAPLSLITIRTHALASDDFSLFYVNTVPSQFGPNYWSVYRSQVLFAHKSDEDTLGFCKRHLVPLDKHDNEVFYIDGEYGASSRLKLCAFFRRSNHRTATVVFFSTNVAQPSTTCFALFLQKLCSHFFQNGLPASEKTF